MIVVSDVFALIDLSILTIIIKGDCLPCDATAIYFINKYYYSPIWKMKITPAIKFVLLN